MNMENHVGTLQCNWERAFGYVFGTEKGKQRPMQSLASATLVEHSRVYAQLTQDCLKRTWRQIAPAMMGNDRELPIGGVPPDFVGTRGLAYKFAAQVAQSTGKLSVVHEEKVRDASRIRREPGRRSGWGTALLQG